MSDYAMGIDIGSLTAKSIIIDSDQNVLAQNIIPTGASIKKACNASISQALEISGLNECDISYTIATGYGRKSVRVADDDVTEITCHARGAHFIRPETRGIIDIGGQDSKTITINEHGKVIQFAMNDKCAAGTGRFLEVMARALEIDLEDMGPLSINSIATVPISSMCTVFAESEVVSLIADGTPVQDIVRGLHMAIADRTIALLGRVRTEGLISMTGGVAKNIGVVRAIEEKLDIELFVPEEPQIAGALGAALIALQRATSQA